METRNVSINAIIGVQVFSPGHGVGVREVRRSNSGEPILFTPYFARDRVIVIRPERFTPPLTSQTLAW